MTKFILHGGFTRHDNELNRSFYREFVKDISESGNILLVYFAGNDEDIGGKTEVDQKMILEAAPAKRLHIEIANAEDFIEQVKRADAIYFRGGSTEKLMSALQRYPDFKHLLKNKTVAGSSAGAYMLSTYNYSNKRKRMREGLGLVPARVNCHFESKTDEGGGDPIGAFKGFHEELPLIILRDYEWKVIPQ